MSGPYRRGSYRDDVIRVYHKRFYYADYIRLISLCMFTGKIKIHVKFEKVTEDGTLEVPNPLLSGSCFTTG